VAGGARGLIAPELGRDGAQLFAGAARAMLPTLANWFDSTPPAPGTRLAALGPFAVFLTGDSPVSMIAKQRLGASARPVRAVAFDKSPATNWALGWHQDRTINIASRAAVEGFGPWTVKQGQLACRATVRIGRKDADAADLS